MPAIDLVEITSTNQLVARNIAAFNAGDYETMTAHLAPDFVYDEVTTGRMTSGVAAFVEGLKAWRAAFPDLTGTITSQASADGLAVCEVSWTGTHRGALQTPQGELAATGRRMTVRSCLVEAIDDDFTQRSTRHYMDVMGMMAQLTGPAVLPGQAPAAD